MCVPISSVCLAIPIVRPERLAPLSMLSIQWRPGWSACAPGWPGVGRVVPLVGMGVRRPRPWLWCRRSRRPSALNVLLASPMARSHPWRRRARDALFLPEKTNYSWGVSRYIVPYGPFLSR